MKFAVMIILYYKIHVIWCDSCFRFLFVVVIPFMMDVGIHNWFPVAEAVNITGIQLLGKQIGM